MKAQSQWGADGLHAGRTGEPWETRGFLGKVGVKARSDMESGRPGMQGGQREVRETRYNGWLQRALYLLMALLGGYIIYKGGVILAGKDGTSSLPVSGEARKAVEDASVRTYAPGYAAAVEERGAARWTAGFIEPLAPVYSYLAELQSEGADTEADGTQPQEKREDEETEDEETEAAGEASGQAYPASAGGGGLRHQWWLSQLQDFDYLLSNFYTVDAGTAADRELLDVRELLGEDLRIRKDPDKPQILIYHTHSQETFADSVEGDESTSIVGMGEVLAQLLRGRGYQVIHDTGVYDLVDGVLDRSAAYDYARAAVEQILAEHPSIEVVIDLHRDGVDGCKFVTEIDGKPTSMVMFFNGLSQDEDGNPLDWLANPYRKENLAFSLQMQLLARQQYPGFTRNIYLKAERYNLHLRPRSLLIEAGTQLNTVEEERNAMGPLASLLAQILGG